MLLSLSSSLLWSIGSPPTIDSIFLRPPIGVHNLRLRNISAICCWLGTVDFTSRNLIDCFVTWLSLSYLLCLYCIGWLHKRLVVSTYCRQSAGFPRELSRHFSHLIPQLPRLDSSQVTCFFSSFYHKELINFGIAAYLYYTTYLNLFRCYIVVKPCLVSLIIFSINKVQTGSIWISVPMCC